MSDLQHSTPALSPMRLDGIDTSPVPRGPRHHSFDPDRRREQALTEREKKVLRLVCEGLTNSAIAEALVVPRDTLKSELKRIFRKIEVNNRTQAAVLLVKQGLL